MLAKRLILVLPLLCLLTTAVMGATVGKITGVITDVQTKEPLVGVSVSIVGTTMGASTDQDGRYTILNVPVGTYTVRMSAVGYANTEIANVEVSADLASYQNRALSSQVTDIGKTISVTAERPLVVKDKTTAMNVIRQDEIQAMPTRGYDQVVGMQNSVVTIHRNVGQVIRGGRETVGATTNELNLRGGRTEEVGYYVDGFSQQDPLSGISTANISNNAIKEISLQSGAFSAEYGNVASGVVNVTTKSGTDKFQGNVDAVTDNLVGSSHSYDQNYYSANVGGPIPKLSKSYYFLSAERRWLGDRDPHAITQDVLPDGSRRLPGNSDGGWSYQGKLDFNFTPNLKLSLSGTGSDDQWSEYRQSYLFDLPHTPWYHDQNLGLNAKLTHTLNAKTFYNLSGSYFKTYRFRGDGTLRDNLWAYGRPPSGNPTYDFTNQRTYFYLGDDPSTPIYDTIVTVDGVSRAFTVGDESHLYDNYYKRKAEYLGLNGDITHEFAETHTLKAGFEFQRHTLRFYENLIPSRVYLGNSLGGFTDVNRYGYDIYGNETDNLPWQNATKHPINFALYLQDRLDLTGMIVNAGIRFDYFDYATQRLRNPQLPLDPDSTYKYGGGVPGSNPQVLDQSDLEPSEKFSRLSPRFGFAFPVTDKSQMHFNYYRMFQRPDLQRMYVGYDYFEHKVKVGGYYYAIGNPNLEPEQTTGYEVGITHQMGDYTSLDVAAYYKDVNNLVEVVRQSSIPNSFAFYENADYGTIKGIELGLSMRRNHNIEMSLKYTLSYANGTGSYANTQQNIAWTATEAPKQTAPLDFDQRHDIIANVDYHLGAKEGPKIGDHFILENFGFNVIARAASGTPFTPATVYDEVTLANVAPVPISPVNSVYGPWTYEIDLKIQREFKFGTYSLTPYIWIKNLLNTNNAYVVYESTGRPNNTGWLDTPPGQDFINATSTPDRLGYTGAQEYEMAQDNPLNYGIPRMILFGVTASF